MGNKKHICSNGMVFFLCSDSSTDSNLFPWEFSNAHIWRPASHTSPQPFIIGKENSTIDSKKYFPRITAYLAQCIALTSTCWQNKETGHSLLSTLLSEAWPRPFSGNLSSRKRSYIWFLESRGEVDKDRKHKWGETTTLPTAGAN